MILKRIFHKLTGVVQRHKTNKLVRRVRANKARRFKGGIPYRDHPKLSLFLISFNHRQLIKPIIERLRLIPDCEIIICEDGSIDGSHQEWMKYLSRPNDFLIHSNDINEIRAYNRAVTFARGEIVCLLQDDDIPPGNAGWVTQALELFERYPKLAILGGYRAIFFAYSGPCKLEIEGKLNKRYCAERKNDIPFLEPGLKTPFMFADCVNTAPVFYRRDAWIELGGFDLNYSKPGETGIRFDFEICFEAWLKGWQVGLYERTDFKRRMGIQGSLFFTDSKRKNEIENGERLERTYGNTYGDIRKLCDEANMSLISNPDYKVESK